jgi:L-aminopeptidase/D-esterase-like protein
MAATGLRNLITDVPGILVGQAEDREGFTGTTIVLAEQPAAASVDVRGGAPGSRETELLAPETLVDRVDAVVLSGGSAFGLDAASGVMDWLAEAGRGFAVGSTLRSPLIRVPIVPAAILFDLGLPSRRAWSSEPPYRALGRSAVAAAAKDFMLGNAGAGLGATAGRLKAQLLTATIAPTTLPSTAGAPSSGRIAGVSGQPIWRSRARSVPSRRPLRRPSTRKTFQAAALPRRPPIRRLLLWPPTLRSTNADAGGWR